MSDIRVCVEKIRNFLDNVAKDGVEKKTYEFRAKSLDYFKSIGIKVELDKHKEIVLQEETGLELGGTNKKSFSIVFPVHQLDLVSDNKITLVGPETQRIEETTVDFGMLVLIGFQKLTEKEYDDVKQFNFVSNGIEGFLIRTIPRKFWCRISHTVIKKFSFEFLGNAIIYLYKQKFKDLIKSIEIVFISSLPTLIDQFFELTKEIRDIQTLKWKEKIDRWKKRIDCDYDWDCKECPYTETCDDLKEAVNTRKEIERSK